MFFCILFIILGFVLLVKGADFLVEGSSNIAQKFHIPQIIIGLTIVAIGTSLPELMVSLTSALDGHSDIAIGNVIGSNISNLFLILGICAAIKPLKFKNTTVRLEIPFVIFLTALFYILGNNNYEKVITKFEGVVLLVFFVLFIIYNMIMAKQNLKISKENNKNNNTSFFKEIIKIIIGIIALKIGGDLVVDNASNLANIFGVSEQLISLTIVSISTSLPELITSITAVLKNELDMAIGNIIGSNIINIVLIIGFSAIINPISYSISYNKDILIFLLGMFILLISPFIGEKNKMSRLNGVGYLVFYISYLSNLVYVNFI